ncbi:MAG TPA: universal stress protein [Armatimonadota bacterium]|nr:universal stress protein [Armatimonadota bacterium]
MFQRILVPMDVSPVDQTVLPHVRALAGAFGSEIILLRVAHYHTRDAREHEVTEAQGYLQTIADALASDGFRVRHLVEHGEPVDAIIGTAEREGADLIAMAGHGHRHMVGWFLGSTIEDVRHRCCVPLLLVRGTEPSSGRLSTPTPGATPT